MTRPPSRSEQLLRETLKRAEEYERMTNPMPSGPGSPPVSQKNEKGTRRHRRSTTSSSVSTDMSFDAFDHQDAVNVVIARAQEQDDDDHDEWLWRSRRGTSTSTDESSSSSGNGHEQQQYQHHTFSHTQQNRAKLARNRSVDYGTGSAGVYMRGFTDSQLVQAQAQLAYGTPTSPSRIEPRRSTKSSPTVPKSRAHSNTVSSPHMGDASHYETPHEAVLRSRLEGVLRGANRARSGERRKEAGSGSASGSGTSMASSRNLSGEGDFFFTGIGDVSISLFGSPLSVT